EQTMPSPTLKEMDLIANNPIESRSLCVLDEQTHSQSEINDEGYKNLNSMLDNKQDQSQDEADTLHAMGQSKSSFNDKTVNEENQQHMIPDEAIRLRILANSDAPTDQHIKKMIRNRVNEHIQNKVALIDKIEKARTVIENT